MPDRLQGRHPVARGAEPLSSGDPAMRQTGVVCALAMLIAAVAPGCASPPTVVRVNAPAGSTMSVGGKKYDLPGAVTVQRPRKAGDERREDVAFTFLALGQTIGAQGVLQVFGYNESDVDRLSANACTIGEAELGQLLEGYALIFDGYSASKQHVFKMTIGKKK
jgi:hypothetical protein